MLYVDWFVRRLKKTFRVVIKENEVSFEAYDFYHGLRNVIYLVSLF